MKKENDNDQHCYDDIINLPHHVSRVHPHMPISGRAAQFSPFAALAGYEDAIDETGRLTDEKVELDEDVQGILDENLRILKSKIAEYPEIRITYFQPDKQKSGGAYITVCGYVKKLDLYGQVIIMQDETEIPVKDITGLEGEIFSVLGRWEE